ncbi:MAG: hypothetical protein HDR82_09560 [Bacteroides sp.]|nr:hypothetical protein [Bacteroides sp.]
MDQLTDIERLVYDAISEIQDIKRAGGQSPDYAMHFEINNFLRPELPPGFETSILKALRLLCRRRLIDFHHTVNGLIMFGIK